MTIANQKILKCSNCRKNYEIYRQKYEKKNEILHMYDIKRISSLLLKNEAERKEMLEKEINGMLKMLKMKQKEKKCWRRK